MTLLVSLSVATSVCGAPSSPVLPGPGAVEAVLADYDDQLRSGRLHEDASRASRVEGGLRDHYAAWADAFSAALRNDAEAPRRIEAMHRLAGYLGGVERYTELRDLYVSLAEVEPMPAAQVRALGLGVTAAIAQARRTSDPEEMRTAITILRTAWARHEAARYRLPSSRSGLSAMLGGYTHELAALAMRQAEGRRDGREGLDTAELVALADLMRHGIDRIEADCAKSDRDHLRSLHAPLGRAMFDTMRVLAVAGETDRVVALFDRRSLLPPDERTWDDGVAVVRIERAAALSADRASYRALVPRLADRLSDRDLHKATVLTNYGWTIGVETSESLRSFDRAFDIAMDTLTEGRPEAKALEAERSARSLVTHHSSRHEREALLYWMKAVEEVATTP